MFRRLIVSSADRFIGSARRATRTTASSRRRPLMLEMLEDRRLMAIVNVTPANAPTAIDNDYTRIDNAVQAAVAGDVIKLKGVFDWTEPFAAASWARGSDDLPGTLDDYAVLAPSNLNNVTITAGHLGQATIKGPGDLPALDYEAAFVFEGGDNQNWTISNVRILDFDLSIGFFNGAGGTDAFNNTKIVNNYIKVATDLSADEFQNIGIHYSFGANQTIRNNTIVFAGDGVSDPDPDFAQSVGMQSNTSGGAVYDGLLIESNKFRVLRAQSSSPESIVGIFENGHAHASDITIRDNVFENSANGNDPALNRQLAFRITSHSSATTKVKYVDNRVQGANLGMQWLDDDFTGVTHPVLVKDNKFDNVFTSINVRFNGLADIKDNTIDGVNSGGAGVLVEDAGTKARIVGNWIRGSFDGIKVDGGVALVEDNDLNKNANSGLLVLGGGMVDAGQSGVGVNFTGLGVSNGGNDFKSYKETGAKAIRNLNTGATYSLAGPNGSPFDVTAQRNRFKRTDLAFIELVVEHDVDNALLGFVDFFNPRKDNGHHEREDDC